MRPGDLFELVALAALWGASFLFLRMGAGEFGPVALAGVRVAGASLFLLPLLLAKGQARALREHWPAIALVGITNSALPFLAYSYAALFITAGLSSIFNAATPLWGAAIAWGWLGDRPTRSRGLGLALGFAGVLWLAWDHAGLRLDAEARSATPAVLACVAATALYGWSANFTRKRLAGVAPIAVAAGSQLSAVLVLAVPTWWWWPQQQPSATAWAAAALLAVACTGVAYVLYFRLIARLGAAKATTVTFLIPAFAVLWGWMFLAEAVTWPMAIAGGVIALGTALATGLISRRTSPARAPAA